MTDHSDLIARLRAHAGFVENGGCAEQSLTDVAALLHRAASALSSQSLSLSEAREEIERLRADIAVKAKLLTKSAKETRAFWDALIPKGGRCRDCADFDGRCQGDGPPCDPQAHALENLAKLQAASPDFSSLRKGAEVAALEYVRPHGSEFLTKAETIIGEACVWTHHEANGAWFWKLGSIASGTEANEADAKKMLWATYEHRIRSALVSGSREDGDG